MIYERQGAGPSAAQASSDSGGVPKLGGSSAGFIVLVVGLAAIVLICCTATFCLLRGHKLDPFEQHARRVLAGKRDATLYEAPLGPQGMRQKSKRFFTFGRKRDGWIRANSGDADEWDASDRLVYDQPKGVDDEESRYVPKAGMYDAPPSRGRQERARPGRNETSDSIELTVPPLSPPPPAADFSPNPSLIRGPTLHRPQVEYTNPFVSESAAPLDDLSGDSRFTVQSRDPSSDAPSHRSMPKFQSGTKFREALEF